jgi:hypothetical protein
MCSTYVTLRTFKPTCMQLLLEAQQHKKYAQTTPLDEDGVSTLFTVKSFTKLKEMYFYGRNKINGRRRIANL